MIIIIIIKGDNFWTVDRVLIGPFAITTISQYLWA